MWLVIIAIIVAGLIIASAIKTSFREANMTPEEKVARYKANQSYNEAKYAKELCNTIYLLSRQGKTDRKIAGNVKIQTLARYAGIEINGEEFIMDLKREPNFLLAIDCYDKFKALIASGASNKKIAKKLYRQYDIMAVNCFTPEDIAVLRGKI
jgi:hypothetical protein